MKVSSKKTAFRQFTFIAGGSSRYKWFFVGGIVDI